MAATPNQTFGPSDKIDLIAFIFGTILSLTAIIIALATYRRTKAKTSRHIGKQDRIRNDARLVTNAA